MSTGTGAGVEATVTTEALHAMPLFEAFSEEQLAWLLEHATQLSSEAGGVLFSEGDPADALYVLVDGRIDIVRSFDGRERVTGGSDDPGAWAGIPVPGAFATITARTPRPSRVLRIDGDAMAHMMTSGFPIATHIVLGLARGMPQFESFARTQERMAVLGKLAAGLAHELNNPAAAARSSAARLGEALAAVATTSVAVGAAAGDAGGDALAALQRDVAERASAGSTADALARSDAEDAVGEWLDDHGVDEPWTLAPDLVDAGLDVAWLDALDALRLHAGSEAGLGAVLAWVRATAVAARLVAEIEEAATRLSDLVGAMKDYSHMDRAPQSDVDVREGLDSTLTILGHKLDGITVRREYDPATPRITAYGGELNQVWTNLIDNAIDALADQGRGGGGDGGRTITLRVSPQAAPDGVVDAVVVEVADDGPGIPPDVLPRVFDPFYTTKPVGQGTGLGLDTVYRIVTASHRGELTADSRPGSTTFRVVLPVAPPT